MDSEAVLRAEFGTQVRLAMSLHEKHASSSTPANRAASDRAIARWSVFLHLRDRPPHLPGALLAELRRLRAEGLPMPIAHVHRPQTYDQARIALIHSLAVRFECESDARTG